MNSLITLLILNFLFSCARTQGIRDTTTPRSLNSLNDSVAYTTSQYSENEPNGSNSSGKGLICQNPDSYTTVKQAVPSHVLIDVGSYQCQGSIVGPRQVLTLRLCVKSLSNYPDKIKVRGGTNQLPNLGYNIIGEKVILDQNDTSNPLAILVLQENLSRINGKNAVLANGSLDITAADKCISVRYGKKKGSFGGAYLDNIRKEKCYSNVSKSETGQINVGDNTLDSDNKRMIECQNDQGLPLSCEIAGREVLVGIRDKTICENPSAFIDIAPYTAWIQQNSK